MRRTFLPLFSMGLLGLLVVPSLVSAGKETAKLGLTNSVFPGLSEKRLQEAARPFRSLFETSTGFTGPVAHGGDPKSLAEKLKQDKVQLGVFQGIEYAWARTWDPKLQPIVICVNQKRTLDAHLIVRANSAFKKPADLRGKVLVLPEESREHCNVFLRRKCISDDSTPKKFFKKVDKAADVEEALDDVVDGKAQATVVDGLAWSSYRAAKPGAAKRLHVLLASEQFPATVVACQSGRFSAAQLKRIRDGLIGARRTAKGKQLLEQLRLTGFEAVPADYERLVSDIVKAYPPPK
jgi:ABC-type phosphate/phosphonate transport system substrate-binding protein